MRLTQGTMFWREVGRGPTLVFLHGSWQDSSQWVPLMEQLGQQFHCLAPDLLGFGESSRLLKGTYSVDLEVTCLAEYLANIRAHPHILIADSLGAWVATRYSLRHPERVRGLVLMAPEGLAHPTFDERWQKMRWLASPWAIRGWGLWLAAPLIRLLKGDRWLQKVRQRQKETRDYQAACKLLFQRHRVALRAEQLNEVLPDLQLPVLLLHPEQASRYTHLANTLFHELVPEAQFLTIPGNEATAWQMTTEKIQVFAKAGAMDSISP